MNFNVTKVQTLEVTNKQIKLIRMSSRAVIMKKLKIKESWARKLKNAVKAGELVETKIHYIQRKEKLVNKANECYGDGRYDESKAPSGKLIAKRYKPTKIATDIFEFAKNKSEFMLLAVDYVSAQTASTWYIHCINWFGNK